MSIKVCINLSSSDIMVFSSVIFTKQSFFLLLLYPVELSNAPVVVAFIFPNIRNVFFCHLLSHSICPFWIYIIQFRNIYIQFIFFFSLLFVVSVIWFQELNFPRYIHNCHVISDIRIYIFFLLGVNFCQLWVSSIVEAYACSLLSDWMKWYI